MKITISDKGESLPAEQAGASGGKKLLFVLPVIVLLAASCNSNQPVAQQNQQTNTPPAQTEQTTPPANTPKEQATLAPVNPEFKLTSKVETVVSDAPIASVVTYSVTVTGVLSRSSGDWTIQIVCPKGVMITSGEGDQDCPTAPLRVTGDSSTFRLKNQATSSQKVVATARLLSGKDNQTPVAVATNTVEIPVSVETNLH
jgi:hypothetical protein